MIPIAAGLIINLRHSCILFEKMNNLTLVFMSELKLKLERFSNEYHIGDDYCGKYWIQIYWKGLTATLSHTHCLTDNDVRRICCAFPTAKILFSCTIVPQFINQFILNYYLCGSLVIVEHKYVKRTNSNSIPGLQYVRWNEKSTSLKSIIGRNYLTRFNCWSITIECRMY